VYKLPDHLSFDDGAMVESLACAVHVSRLGVLTPLDRLLIVGAGTIGLLVLQSAKVYGLTDVIVMDINPERLEIARELGGTPVLNRDELAKLTPAHGFDIAVDAVGMDVTRQQCMHAVKRGGRVIFTGLHASYSVLPINIAVRNELSLCGAFAYNPIDFEIVLDWFSDGKVNIQTWITHVSVDEGAACFQKLITNPGKTAKIIMSI
jgi:2-desacetyl-2-hydroxyethyl bacteriochlorophyllide A dehydrogenase